MKGSCLKNVRMTGKKSLYMVKFKIRYMKNARHKNVPKEVQESNSLHNHADERPFEKDQQDSTNETSGPSELLFSCEEVESLLRTDDQCEAGEE